jgi:Zn-finger nucleic acid-binding protein
MTLACPACHTLMEPVDYAGLRLDVCPECAGIWFDSGELLALSRSAPGAMEKLEAKYQPNIEVLSPEPVLKKCPRDGTALDRHRYDYDSPVKIDSCPRCHGVFVEDQELTGIQSAILDEDRIHLTAAMKARARLAGKALPDPEGRDPEADVSALIQALAHWREHSTAQA